MKPSSTTALIRCAVLLLTISVSYASLPTANARQEAGEYASAEKREASDQAMQSALGQLQAAAVAVDQNDGAIALSDLQSALALMNNALPIYKGHREKAIEAAEKATKELQRNGKRSTPRVSEHIDKAVSEAQQCVDK